MPEPRPRADVPAPRVGGTMRLRVATSGDEELRARATLGNVNWSGPRITADQVRSDPHLWHYVAAWPGAGDFGYVAESEPGRWVGVVWLTHFPASDPGYGFVHEAVPELSIHVDGPHRGRGVGTRLMDAVIDSARHQELPGISLSVELGNPAARLYARHGFVPAGPDHDPGTLLLRLDAPRTRRSRPDIGAGQGAGTTPGRHP